MQCGFEKKNVNTLSAPPSPCTPSPPKHQNNEARVGMRARARSPSEAGAGRGPVFPRPRRSPGGRARALHPAPFRPKMLRQAGCGAPGSAQGGAVRIVLSPLQVPPGGPASSHKETPPQRQQSPGPSTPSHCARPAPAAAHRALAPSPASSPAPSLPRKQRSVAPTPPLTSRTSGSSRKTMP